jgi:HD-GYP domain-containing protein (c-di-GMP phosphodiesterase class II)
MPMALEELRRCSGTQFDPEVVAALEAALAQPTPEPGEQDSVAGIAAAMA